jgi:DNA-binding transcriptional MerR regulator
MGERLTIGDLAKATGTKVVTVRYYEQAGLLPAPPHTSGNYRTYRAGHLHRLRFIRRCRDLGFTLDQVRDLLRLSTQEKQPCTEVNLISAEHLTAIEQKIADLTRLADELRRIKWARRESLRAKYYGHVPPDRTSRIYKVTFVEGARAAALTGRPDRRLRNLAWPNGRLEPGRLEAVS